MTRVRTALTGAAALVAAVLVFAAFVLPPASRRLPLPAWSPDGTIVSGAFHVHTVRSDGTGTVAQVAEAAARAGLRFVIFTDHGDATRPPDPPAYHAGVLCIDAVEISTSGGHYVALGLGPAPYPLGGDPREVVEDVARLGGFGVVTHPDSPKDALKWDGWNQPFPALEWLNADSEWRDESVWRLGRALIAYPFRGPETVASLFDRPRTLARWDRICRARRVIALAGADAHARVAWKAEADPYSGGASLPIPSYEASFRAFSLRVTLDQPLTGRGAEDASRLLAAIRAGHVHTIIDARARPGVFEFTARAGAARVREGDSVTPGEDAVVLRARSNGPAGTRLVLFRDGSEVNRVTANELVYATNRPGAYRVEAWLPSVAEPAMPWVSSNPIFVGLPAPPPPAGTAADPAVLARLANEGGWQVEHDAHSSGSTGVRAAGASLRFELGAGPARTQFVALAHGVQLPADADGIAFRAAAGAPMRVSVQLRAPGSGVGERWAFSVYLDSSEREVVVPFSEMRPAGATSSATPRTTASRTVLFVVERTHARAGAAGEFRVEDLRAVTLK